MQFCSEYMLWYYDHMPVRLYFETLEKANENHKKVAEFSGLRYAKVWNVTTGDTLSYTSFAEGIN